MARIVHGTLHDGSTGWHCEHCSAEFPGMVGDAHIEIPAQCPHCESEENLVAIGHGCPNCGERDVDCLQWLEDAEYDVHCLTCDTEYDLPLAEPDIDSRREDHYLAGVVLSGKSLT